MVVVEGCKVGGGEGEVGLGLDAAELAGGSIIGTRSLLSGVKGAEPDAGLLAWVADLGGIPTPGPLPHASESDLLRARVLVNGAGSISRCHWFQ